MAIPPIFGALLILSPAMNRLGTRQAGGAYVANLPICGAILILSPALKRWGPPRRQGLCRHFAHLWGTADFVRRSEALGTPQKTEAM